MKTSNKKYLFICLENKEILEVNQLENYHEYLQELQKDGSKWIGKSYKNINERDSAKKLIEQRFQKFFVCKETDNLQDLKADISIFTDGSRIPSKTPGEEQAGYGLVIVTKDKKILDTDSGKVDDEYNAMGNFSGEFEGALKAIDYANKNFKLVNEKKSFNLVFDYNGIGRVFLGIDEAKTGIAQNFLNNCLTNNTLDINFYWVASHVGTKNASYNDINYFNDMADSLARNACR